MDQSISSPSSSRLYWSTEDVQRAIDQTRIVVFAKGSPKKPRCGFARRVFDAIEGSGQPYSVVDLCQDRSIGAALKKHVGRHSSPLLFVDGKFVASSEQLERMVENGELKSRLEKIVY